MRDGDGAADVLGLLLYLLLYIFYLNVAKGSPASLFLNTAWRDFTRVIPRCFIVISIHFIVQIGPFSY